MDSLSDVMSYCRGLDTDKVSERKKNAEKLRQLLERKSVVRTLDQNTDERLSGRNNNRLITWDDVFKAAVLYVRLETAALQKGKEPQSQTAQLNKEKKKLEISGFFKYIVRTADKRGPRLKYQSLISHILEVLKDDYCCSAYGQDYSSVLLKDVLPVRKYWVDIRTDTWHDLLHQYFRLFLDPDCSMEHVVLARLIHVIIAGASRQCDLHTKKVILFFTEVFKNIRQEKGSQVSEHLLMALNVFVRRIAPSARIQVCKLGEGIFLNLLYLWNNRPTDNMKDEIVEFMRVQLQAHHPGGAKCSESGELAVDRDLWMSHLRKLYELMYTDLQQMGGRNRFSSGTKEAVLKAAYVDLAADVCNQLFSETSHTIEVTQLSLQEGEGEGDHSTPRKKRRLESGWSVVRDTMYGTAGSYQLIPWLQLVTRLVEKYPSSIPEEELLPLLQCLHKMLNDCKKSEVLRHIFQCLVVMVNSYPAFQHITIATIVSTQSIWQSIWSSTLRSISSHQADAEGYQQFGFYLLAAMVDHKLITPEKDVWNLFLPNVSSPSNASIHFLSVCLKSHDLPENHQPSILGSSSCVVKGSYPLRTHLLNWILPKRDVSEPSLKQTRLDPSLASRVLTSLIVRNPQSFMADSCSQDKQDHATELEKLYLETTFNRALRIEKIFETVSCVTDKHNLPLMPCLLNTMKDIFERECVYFQAINDIQVSTLHDSISCCSIVAKCLQNMLESGVTSPAAMADTGLELCLKTLLRQMSILLSDYVKKEGTGSLLPVVSALRSLFPDPASHSLGGFVVAELLRSLLPGKFYDVLFDIAFSKMSRCNSNSNNSVQLGSLRRRRGSTDPRAGHMDRGRGRGDDLMDLDLDLDDAPNSHNNGREDDDDEVDFEMGESQESDELNHSDMCSSLVLDDALPETQRLRLEVVRVLCACCNHERSVAPGDVPYRAEVETGFLKNKLEELFEENMFDPNRALDILVMETIIRNFTKKSHKVSDMDLENMLDAIRQAAKAQRRDQEVCCLLLELMTLLVPHLGDPDDLPSKVKKECREITLKLLSAFFKLREDGQYAAPVRLNIARCMQAFIQCDPEGGWSYLAMRREGEDTSESLCKEFPNCILDGCHLTRSYVAEAVQCLFVIRGEKELQPKPSSSQHEAFDLLYQNCNDLMEIKGKMSPERQHDERLSRTASVLSVLATVACTSPINEKKAVFAVCQLIRERDIEVEKVNKVLIRLSKHLGYEEVKQFVKSHLPFLLSQWLELDYQLNEFPARLLGCDTTLQFYRSHKDVIVPTLFMQGQTECIESLAGELGEGLEEVLQLCTPQIVVHILPLFAASKSDLVRGDKAVKKSLVLANKRYDCLVNKLTKEVTDQIIHTNLDMIVVNVLRCLHVTAQGVDTDTRCVPDPNPPSYSSEIVRSTLDFLTHSSAGNNQSLISVLAKTQSSLQKVLLELTSSLFLEHRVQEKRRILAMLQLFVEMLLPEFAGQLGGSWVFVLRDLIHRLIQVIADVQAHHRDVFESDAELRVSMMEMCLEMLRSICSVALECCHEELGKYIDHIVSSVLKFLKQPGPLQEKCQSLLSLLLLENATLLREAIGRLDPLPESAEYRDYRSVQNRLHKHQANQTLAQKLERWLCVVQEKRTDTCVETLRSLADLISSSRQHLTCLMAGQDLEGQKVVCQIVSELLHLTQSPHHQVALQAASCLGVIGPVDLATISLPRRRPRPGLSECLTAYSEEPICQNYCWVFHTLNQYLLEPGVEVVKTAGQVLRFILATRRGIEFSSDYKTRLTDRDYLFSYLHPFKSKKPSPSERTPLNMEHFLASVNTDSLWVPDHADHTRWVTDITCALLRSTAVTDEVLCLLEPICRIKPEFCELVLPFLVHDVLMGGTEDMGHVISSRINFFFLAHCRSVHGQQAHSKSGSVCTNKDSIQTMLNVVQYLRQQERPRKGRKVLTPWDNNFWLDVNYLEIAQAALFCAAPFTAILYAEIWSNSQREEESRGSSSNRSQRLSQDSEDLRIDTLSSVTSSSVKLNIQELLLEAYESVSDPDGVYGCGAGRLADQTSRIKTYLHENRLEKAVVTYDIGMNKGKEEQEFGLLKTVQDFGADHLLALCLQSKLNSAQGVISPELEEIQYEAAWRTGQWNLEVPSRQQKVPCYHQSVYSALEALKDQQLSLAQSFIDTARQTTLHMIDTRPESCRSVYPVLSRLHSLYHLQQIVHALDSSDLDQMQTLLQSLNTEEEEKNEFEFVQPVMDVTLAALKILTNQKVPTNRDGLSVADTLRAQQYKMARFSRKEGKYQVAERIISELKQESVEPQLQLVIEEAKLYWARDEQNIAKHLIKSLISKLEKLQDDSFEAVRLLPQALGVYGGWLAETRTENPGVILENYLEKTVELLDPSSTDDIVEAYMSLAQFVDTQYQNINNYMKSSTFEAKQALMRKAKMDAQSFRQHLSEKDRYLRALDKQGEIDEREVEALTEDREKFLLKAVENYIKCLRAGDRHDLRIYRLTSLWFDNAASEEVNELINNNTSEIKSYKFLPLMYQLAARMTVKLNNCPLFQPTLAKILETACIDHPHHTVSVIMALAHANKDMELLLQGRSNKRTGKLSRTVSEADSQEEDRVQAAKVLIDRLKNNGKVSQIVRNMEVLSVAYIQLANTNVDKFKNEKKPIPLPSTLMISQMKNLTAVALPTIETKLDPTGQYKDVVIIVGFEDTFRLAGGVNLPKILSIIGSDGVHRRQLVKGRDDLRQDAVMQQVFGMVNSLLEKNPETKKRNLRIRTYKVVPLSQRSGVLEWCEGTQPLGEYLIGSPSVKGAHAKYRPQDISAGQCREAFGKMRGEADLKKKRRVFQDVCDRFQPIFRHFFMEQFADPAVWFEKRLAYSRSVATNSIIGYILGLGDRHVMNILIDKNSAELVHIDLGIAFEQGKILPTPETVPFRLTRDIVDGMGVTGVEGVFRRCCEKTMWVMHSNQECLLMILQVLLYDPLYAWSLSPQQALQIQRRGREDLDTSDLNTTSSETDLVQQTERSAESQENVNKMAERVLLRLQQKLQGIEDGIQLSVSGQVNNLIQEARDPNNLCRLFVGWQPYL